MTHTYKELQLTQPFLQSTWDEENFDNPTDIQLEAIPAILKGRDVLAESPTGTGKTLAYLLPILERIDPNKKDPQAVVLAPTRELVMQILEVVQKWAKGSGVQGISLIGGANVKRQVEKLKKKHPQIIVGTPGRIKELITIKKLKMHEVKTIVLDEGDHLLVPEQLPTIQSVIKSTLSDRQVLLFSATLPKVTEEFGREWMAEPARIQVTQSKQTAAANVAHFYVVTEHREKTKVLEKLVRMQEVKALAFGKDIGELAVLNDKLRYKNVPVGLLHSELDKTERQTALKQFRTGKLNLLLATDVAARGLDIKGVTHVIQINIAEDTNQYIHRSGRTGRAGESGTVVSIVTPGEEWKLKKLTNLGIHVQKKTFYQGHMVDED